MNTDDQIKLAQAQLIQHTAEQMGVDVNELSSEELAKFASHVLSESGSVEEEAEVMEKVAEADALGRLMARSFVQEQQQIEVATNVQEKVAGAMYDVAAAWSEKVAAEAERPFMDKAKSIVARYSGYRDIKRGIAERKAAEEMAALMGDNPLSAKLKDMALSEGNKSILKGVGKATLATAGVGGLGYLGYRALRGPSEEEAKMAALSEAELAEIRAMTQEGAPVKVNTRSPQTLAGLAKLKNKVQAMGEKFKAERAAANGPTLVGRSSTLARTIAPAIPVAPATMAGRVSGPATMAGMVPVSGAASTVAPLKGVTGRYTLPSPSDMSEVSTLSRVKDYITRHPYRSAGIGAAAAGLGYLGYRAMNDDEAKVAAYQAAAELDALGYHDLAIKVAAATMSGDTAFGLPPSQMSFTDRARALAARASGYDDITEALAERKNLLQSGSAGELNAANNKFLRGAGKASLTAAGVGGLGYLGYRALSGPSEEEAKIAAYQTAAELDALGYHDLAIKVAAEAAAGPSFMDKAKGFAGRYSGYDDISEGLKMRKALLAAAADPTGARQLNDINNRILRGVGKAGLTAAGAGGLGYLGYRALSGPSEEEAKVAGYEFSKLAEARAAEIMAANGIHPETFEAIEPVAVKIAQVATPEDFYTYEEKVASLQFNQELDAAAAHILNSLGLV